MQQMMSRSPTTPSLPTQESFIRKMRKILTMLFPHDGLETWCLNIFFSLVYHLLVFRTLKKLTLSINVLCEATDISLFVIIRTWGVSLVDGFIFFN